MTTQKLLRHVSAADGMGVSDDVRVYGSATYHCTSAHGPACPARGAVGELANTASADDDDLEEDDDAVVIVHMAHVGKDVDAAQIMRLFEGGAFEEALRKVKRKPNPGGGDGAASEAAAAKRRDPAMSTKRFFHSRRGGETGDGDFFERGETDAFVRDDDDGARYGVTGAALPHDAATTWQAGVRSTPSRETRKVEFLNARSKTIAVYWVDFDGKETHYVDLPPGMTTLMSTFATHSWVARDMASTHAIAVFTVRAWSRSQDTDPTQRFVVVDELFGEAAAEAPRARAGPAPAEPEGAAASDRASERVADGGATGGDVAEEGDAGDANPDGKKKGGGGRPRERRPPRGNCRRVLFLSFDI